MPLVPSIVGNFGVFLLFFFRLEPCSLRHTPFAMRGDAVQLAAVEETFWHYRRSGLFDFGDQQRMHDGRQTQGTNGQAMDDQTVLIERMDGIDRTNATVLCRE